MFLKQVSSREANFRVLESKYASFKNIKLPWGNYQADNFRDVNTLLPSLFTTKSSSERRFKTHIVLFSTLLEERRHSKR